MQEHHLNLYADSTDTEEVSGEYFNNLLNELAAALEELNADNEQSNQGLHYAIKRK